MHKIIEKVFKMTSRERMTRLCLLVTAKEIGNIMPNEEFELNLIQTIRKANGEIDKVIKNWDENPDIDPRIPRCFTIGHKNSESSNEEVKAMEAEPISSGTFHFPYIPLNLRTYGFNAFAEENTMFLFAYEAINFVGCVIPERIEYLAPKFEKIDITAIVAWRHYA